MSILRIVLPMLLASISLAQDADLLLRHGKVIDGAGNAWFHADVAVKDGRIMAVGDLDRLIAARTVDVGGLIVAPGFIDVHTHADEGLLRQPSAENFIRDGVTTIVTGNCGYGVNDVAEYFQKLQARGCALNVATLIGHNSVLRAVKGNQKGELTPAQMDDARAIIEKAMKDGAVGLSTGLIYTPGQWSSTEEIIELAKVAARHGGIYATHMRSESMAILAAIDEALRVGREAGCRVEISHFKLPGDVAAKIGGSDTTLKKVLDARAAGQEVWLDQYPYTASSTGISTLLPDWVLEKGGDEARAILNDPQRLERVLADMKQSNEVARGRTDMSYVVIASADKYPQFVGQNIKQIAAATKLRRENPDAELLDTKLPAVTMEDQYRAIIELYINGGASVVLHSQVEKEVVNILRCPLVSIASDSGVREFNSGSPHPRGYGTNARVLGRYVREQRAITLEDAVRKMTSQPATAFRFMDRGLVRAGYKADLSIFDADTVIDRSTYEKPHAYSEGFEYLIVTGKIVLEKGQMTGALPGEPIPGPGFDRSVRAE